MANIELQELQMQESGVLSPLKANCSIYKEWTYSPTYQGTVFLS